MESITKNRQPAETLRAMAERAYGPGQVPAASADWVSGQLDEAMALLGCRSR